MSVIPPQNTTEISPKQNLSTTTPHISKFKFSFGALKRFLLTNRAEVVEVSTQLIFGGHILSSWLLWSIGIVRRNFKLITLKVMLHGTIWNDDF